MESPKRRKICKLNDTNAKVAILYIEVLPNEILMKIFSHLNIKESYNCAQVSKKIQTNHFGSLQTCTVKGFLCQFVAPILELETE